jgi:hypothetical protein
MLVTHLFCGLLLSTAATVAALLFGHSSLEVLQAYMLAGTIGVLVSARTLLTRTDYGQDL